MHLLPVYYSTTNTRKRKQKKKSASVLEAERNHEKFLKKICLGSRSSAGTEQRFSKPWVTGSSPVENANSQSRSLTVKHPSYTRLDVSRLESDPGSNPGETTNSSSICYHPSMAKKESMQYTGTEIIGIAQMHKSNAVPVRGRKQAIDIANMRRG